MARIIELMQQVPSIIDQIYENSRKADQFRELENQAAIKIQSWYRAVKVRSYIKFLDKNATVIQRLWRGYQGRRRYRKKLEERVKQMRLEFYNEKAILIQKVWRGYYSRKYVFNYYKRKAYLQAIEQKNEIVLNELREYKDYMDRQEEERRNIEKYKRLEQDAKKSHYLISTKQIPGVYNSPYKPAPTEMEYILRNVKLDPAEKHDLYVKSLKANKFDAITLPDYLPPLANKPQGPFKDPLDVRKQRYRPFSPSLRVETDYECLEKGRQNWKSKEWTERLHDEIFYPIDKSIYKKPYQPLIVSKSKYGSLDYGTKHFREESNPEEWNGSRFKTLVPPIPEFGKLNKTYVESHYYMS